MNANRALGLLASLLLVSCISKREGWAARGKYRILHESPTLQVRRGPQVLDPTSGEVVLAWVGARSPAGEIDLVACEITVYDDRDGDGAPAEDEILHWRETREACRKILFGDVRAGGRAPRARLVASTARESCDVGWSLRPD